MLTLSNSKLNKLNLFHYYLTYFKMTKNLFFLFVFFLALSCSDNNVGNKNPYIPGYSFTVDINTSLPAYSNLKFAGNAVFYAGAGARGLIIFNTGSGYNAFDAACPNQSLSDCSTLTIKGINAICPCDSKEYSLFTGLSDLQYPMKQYRVEVSGGIIRVYN